MGADPLGGRWMINVRYHVFSLIAVFLALAIGLAAGSTVVKESIVDNLRDNQDRLESQLDELLAANEELDLRVGRLEETDRRLRGEGPLALLDARLLGMTIVLIRGEGLDGDVRNAVLDTLAAAGAELAGEIEVRRDMVREERSAELAELVGAGADDDPVAVTAQALAAALVVIDAPEGGTDPGAEPGGPPSEGVADLGAEGDTAGTETSETGATDEAGADEPAQDGEAQDEAQEESQEEAQDEAQEEAQEESQEEAPPAPERVALDELLSVLEDGGFLAADGPVTDAEALIARAPTFVVVGGRPDDDELTATPFLTALVTDVVNADDGRTRVAIGDAALIDPSEPRSPFVEAVREVGDTWDRVTSVDDLEMFAGLAALALGIDDLRVGRMGHYGVGEGADSLLPVDP